MCSEVEIVVGNRHYISLDRGIFENTEEPFTD